MSGKKRRRLKPEDRRAVIVSAALEVFANEGYDRASMRAVAKAAGVTTPVLYDHFASKADLYATIVEQEADALIDRWEGAGLHISDGGGAEDMFAESVGTIFDWATQNEAAWRIIFLDEPTDPVVAKAHARRQARASQVLAAQFGQIGFLHLSVPLDRERANEFLAEATKWTVNAIAAWWWSNRDLTRDQIMQMTHALMWRGLGHVTGEPV